MTSYRYSRPPNALEWVSSPAPHSTTGGSSRLIIGRRVTRAAASCGGFRVRPTHQSSLPLWATRSRSMGGRIARSRRVLRGADWIRDSHEYLLPPLHIGGQKLQGAIRVCLTGDCEVEPWDLQLEDLREALRVVHFSAMRRVPVAALTDVNAHPLPLPGLEPAEYLVVYRHELLQQLATRVH